MNESKETDRLMQIAQRIGETLITEVDGPADAMLVLTAFIVWQIAKQ